MAHPAPGRCSMPSSGSLSSPEIHKRCEKCEKQFVCSIFFVSLRYYESSPFGTEKNLFVLFNGKFVNKPGHDLLAKDILVFDWNGNPVCRYNLDMGVSRIAVDEDKRKI